VTLEAREPCRALLRRHAVEDRHRRRDVAADVGLHHRVRQLAALPQDPPEGQRVRDDETGEQHERDAAEERARQEGHAGASRGDTSAQKT
jgi:hypothetical protein